MLFAIIALGVLVVVYDRWRARQERVQDRHILAAADKYSVDPALVKAVVWKESRFKPRARGKAGEIGLMQIREPAAREWAEAENIRFFQHRQLFDPAQNTMAGTWYLSKLLKRYQHTDDPLPYALADYNAGRRNVLRWAKGPATTRGEAFIRQIGFPTTKDYVRSVIKRYRHYQKTFPQSTS